MDGEIAKETTIFGIDHVEFELRVRVAFRCFFFFVPCAGEVMALTKLLRYFVNWKGIVLFHQ